MLADIPSRLPEVMADPAIAERVIVNLAGNALRYSRAAAPPLLTARTAGKPRPAGAGAVGQQVNQ